MKMTDDIIILFLISTAVIIIVSWETWVGVKLPPKLFCKCVTVYFCMGVMPEYDKSEWPQNVIFTLQGQK